MHERSLEVKEKEMGQLDSLFITLREDLIESHKEERRRKRRAKKNRKSRSKTKKHKKRKHSRSFIEIEERGPSSASFVMVGEQVDRPSDKSFVQ